MNFIFKCYFLNMYNKSVLKLAYKTCFKFKAGLVCFLYCGNTCLKSHLYTKKSVVIRVHCSGLVLIVYFERETPYQ